MKGECFPVTNFLPFKKVLKDNFYHFSLRACKLSCRYFSGKGRMGDKCPLCAFFYIFPQLKNDRKHQQLLGEIEHLKSEKDVAESKIRQLQLQMSMEEEEVSKAQEERDEYKAEVSKLQLEVEGLKAHVANNDNDNNNNSYDDDVVDDQMMIMITMMMMMIMMMMIRCFKLPGNAFVYQSHVT